MSKPVAEFSLLLPEGKRMAVQKPEVTAAFVEARNINASREARGLPRVVLFHRPSGTTWDVAPDADVLALVDAWQKKHAAPRATRNMKVRYWLHEWVSYVGENMPSFLLDRLDCEVASPQEAVDLVNLRIENYRMWLEGVKPRLPLEIRMGTPVQDYQDLLEAHVVPKAEVA